MKKISDILNRIIGYETIKNYEISIFNSWTHIVEEAFAGSTISKEIQTKAAESSKIREIENEKIIIEVLHTGWIQILSAKQNELLEVLHKKYKDTTINEIDFVLYKP